MANRARNNSKISAGDMLGSTTTNSYGVAAIDFVSVSGCDQLVMCPIHVRGGTFDFLITDASELGQVTVVAVLN